MCDITVIGAGTSFTAEEVSALVKKCDTLQVESCYKEVEMARLFSAPAGARELVQKHVDTERADPINACANGEFSQPLPRFPDMPFTAQASDDPQERYRGMFFVLLSSIGFSLASVLIKLDKQPSGASFPTLEIGILRAIIGLIFGVVGIKVAHLPFCPAIELTILRLSLLRGTLDFLASNLFYFACAELPIAIATVIYLTNPFWAGLMARIFLGERYDMKKAAILCLGSVGTLLALWPELSHGRLMLSPFGLAAAILGSLFQAGQYVAGRACSEGNLHWLYQNFAYSCAGIALGPPALKAFSDFGVKSQMFVPLEAMTFQETVVTLGTVLCALASQLWLIQGMGLIPASMTAAIRTLDIPCAIIWALVLLRSVPNIFQILGGALLLSACILLSRLRR
jgi:drug/metabolite transporter (DMT)-like permease